MPIVTNEPNDRVVSFQMILSVENTTYNDRIAFLQVTMYTSSCFVQKGSAHFEAALLSILSSLSLLYLAQVMALNTLCWEPFM